MQTEGVWLELCEGGREVRVSVIINDDNYMIDGKVIIDGA